MYHIFDTDIAAMFGVNAAILFQNFCYWCEYNRANEQNYHDGYYWTYNSRKAFTELFPYMSAKQVSGAIDKLEQAGLIIKGIYNKDLRDRTLWYAVTERGIAMYQKGNMESSKRENGEPQKGKCIYTNINTNINSNKERDRERANELSESQESALSESQETALSEKSPRKRYGEYNHVLLSEKEHSKLIEDFGEEIAARYIRKVDEYCEQSGRRYKNYYLAIRNTFMARDGVKPVDKEDAEKWGMIL